MAVSLPILDGLAPVVRLAHLDELWFQVAGTLCNLECRHCFISCSPHNHAFGFLGLEEVRSALVQSQDLGVKEYYFTGGEPFLNPAMTAILEVALEYGPATVLTNGTVFKEEWLSRLAAARDASPYSLEFRVSIDGFTAGENDPIRGPGTFERALGGVRQLLDHDFLPIITVARTRRDQDDMVLFEGFDRMLRARGYERPRIKILPTLRIGAEESRTAGYGDDERVTAEMLADFDQDKLICNHARMVTDRGVFVCPILIESRDARLGANLAEATGGFALRHRVCFTCYQYGTICANASSGPRDA
jgi:sulfatase maturation enzyme AslB (radical SAM superfamily)